MRYFFFITVTVALIFVFNTANSQDIKVYDGFESFEPLLHKQSDTTYIINFWATWCAPCVKELPYFQEAYEKYKDTNVKIMLVSLDFGSSAKERVKQFIEARNITADVMILDDPKSNAWINKVNDSWSGALPATVIYNKDSRSFYEQSFKKKELFTEIKSKTQ